MLGLSSNPDKMPFEDKEAGPEGSALALTVEPGGPLFVHPNVTYLCELHWH